MEEVVKLTFDRPSLAFESQPDLETLLRLLATTHEPVTIVCGAGLSVEAGYPTWATLIDRMCDHAPAPLSGMLKADSADVLRKAEYVLDMASGLLTGRELVRNALYEGGVADEPGLIADAVARLASSRDQTRLLTTNFDNQMETALERYRSKPAQPFELGRAGDWLSAPARDAGVLHVHGLISPGSGPQLEPLILSESQFRKHGAEVRGVIRRALDASTVVFVGVSLTDPNLVGPLSDAAAAGGGGPHFALAVAERLPGYEPADSFEYVVSKASYLRKAFGLSPILLKSYGQISQLLYDASLAIAHPQRYFSANKQTSLRYGHRFQRALGAAYKGAGATGKADVPVKEAARTFSDALRRALEGRDGPERFLRDLAARKSDRELARHGISREYVRSEQFGLFVWLRARAPSASQFPPFALRLVGTSAYAHWLPWSSQQTQEIQPGDPPYADAAFRGNADSSNLTDRDGWRYAFSVPLIRTAEGDLDVLALGVVELRSTRPVQDLSTLLEAAAAKADVQAQLSPSILSFISDDDRKRLKELVARSALKALSVT